MLLAFIGLGVRRWSGSICYGLDSLDYSVSFSKMLLLSIIRLLVHRAWFFPFSLRLALRDMLKLEHSVFTCLTRAHLAILTYNCRVTHKAAAINY